jgi:hypothetical protein
MRVIDSLSDSPRKKELEVPETQCLRIERHGRGVLSTRGDPIFQRGPMNPECRYQG